MKDVQMNNGKAFPPPPIAQQSATNVTMVILINTHLIIEHSHLMFANQIRDLFKKFPVKRQMNKFPSGCMGCP